MTMRKKTPYPIKLLYCNPVTSAAFWTFNHKRHNKVNSIHRPAMAAV